MINDNYIFYKGEKFKTGDKVTCILNDTKITNAKIIILFRDQFCEYDIPSAYNNKSYVAYICQNMAEGWEFDGDKFDYDYTWIFSSIDQEELLKYPSGFDEKEIEHQLTDGVYYLKKNNPDQLARIVGLAFQNSKESL
jgi:hypothetical protein